MTEFNREAFIDEFITNLLDKDLEGDVPMDNEIPETTSAEETLGIMRDILSKVDEMEELEDFQEERVKEFRNLVFSAALMVAAEQLGLSDSGTEEEGTEASAKEPADSAADEVPFDMDGPESGGYALPKEEKEEKTEDKEA